MDIYYQQLADSGIRISDISPWYMIFLLYFGITTLGFFWYMIMWVWQQIWKNLK